jgi:hypothetical protein
MMAGSTPIYGFPYPEATDLVADYPALGQELAEDVETVLTGLGTWDDYTPTVNGLTIGNGTVAFRYVQIRNTVFVHGKITAGSTTTGTGSNIGATLPVTASTSKPSSGSCYLNDASAVKVYDANVRLQSSTLFDLVNGGGTYGTVVNGNPFTWANSDFLVVSFFYEAA